MGTLTSTWVRALTDKLDLQQAEASNPNPTSPLHICFERQYRQRMASKDQKRFNVPVSSVPALTNLQMFLTITAVAGATFLSTLLSGMLTVAIPTIALQLGITEGAMQWPVSMNSLVNGAFLLVAGGLADTFGRKSLFLVGTGLFAIISLGVSYAHTEVAFIILLALLGLAPAILSPAGAGILGGKLPPGRMKNIGFATLGAGQPVGFVGGLIAGGALASRWQIMFRILSGSSAAFFVLAIYALPSDVRRSRSEMWSEVKAFDWVGSLLSTGAAVSLIFALSDAGVAPQGWREPYIPALITTSTTLIVSFLWWEEKRQQRGRHALLPPSIWSAKGLPSLVSFLFFAWGAFNSMFYLSSLMFQQVQRLSPVRTAVYFLPAPVLGIVLIIIGTNLIGRLSVFQVIAIGQLISIACNVLFATLDPEAPYFLGLFWVELFGTGPDIFFPAASIYLQNCVGEAHQALAGSLFMIATRWATSFALSVCSTIMTSIAAKYQSAHPSATAQEALLQGLRGAGWACFAWSFLALLIAAWGLRGAMADNGKGSSSSEPTDSDSEDEKPLPVVTRSSILGPPRASTRPPRLSVDLPGWSGYGGDLTIMINDKAW